MNIPTIPRTTALPTLLLAFLLCLTPRALAGTGYQYRNDLRIPVRDGTLLAANLFLPEGRGPWPVILVRTPYGRQGEDWPEAKRYAREGYATVVQDTRGRGDSGGRWDPFLLDAEDGHDTQQWIGAQPWCNGRIGAAGGSYGGWTQWASAPLASPFLKTMVPVVPFGEAYDLAYIGGAMQMALLMGWGLANGGVWLAPPLLDEAFRFLPLDRFGEQFTREVPYFADWVRHPRRDAFWRVRGMDFRYDRVRATALNVGGWYDIFAQQTLDLTRRVRQEARDPAARAGQHVVMGPWTHALGSRHVGQLDFGPEAALDFGALQRAWFAEHLAGQPRTGPARAPYRLFVMGENRWRESSEWPLPDTRWTPFYLQGEGNANTRLGDGRLSTDPPRGGAPDHYVYDGDDPVPTHGGNNLVGPGMGPMDQSGIELRQDVLVYTSAPLSADLEVTGPVELRLWAASSAPDTDFTAKLLDVHPDGRAFNLCEGILRARFRDGDGEGQERLLEPGKPEEFGISLWSTSNLFRAGHRIRLEVSSSNFPRFDRNPNSGKPWGSDTAMLPARQTVFHDPARPSRLVLPVIPR